MGFADYIGLVGLIMLVIGVWKMKFGGELFKELLIAVVGLSI